MWESGQRPMFVFVFFFCKKNFLWTNEGDRFEREISKEVSRKRFKVNRSLTNKTQNKKRLFHLVIEWLCIWQGCVCRYWPWYSIGVSFASHRLQYSNAICQTDEYAHYIHTCAQWRTLAGKWTSKSDRLFVISRRKCRLFTMNYQELLQAANK